MTAERSGVPAAGQGSLLWLIACCMMLQPLSTDLYLASLPHLTGYFSATPAEVQRTLSLFVVGFGAAQLVVGPLSDRFGRRPVLLGGLALYVAASVACALAATLPALIAGRFGQAVGSCAAVLIARAVIRDSFSVEEGARMVARASSLLSLAPILGPIAGGYLQIAFGWRAAFMVHTLLGASLLVAVRSRLHETNARPDPGATRPASLARNYAEILRSPAFLAYALPGALSYGSIFAFISGSSFVLIRVLGVPTQDYGYCFAFGVVGYLVGTLLCRRLLARIGVARTLTFGTVVAAFAGVSFPVLVGLGLIHWAAVVASMCLVMAAHGINFTCAQTSTVAPFPHRAGAAAGLYGFLTMAAALAVGTWVGATHNGTLWPLAWTAATLGLAIWAVAWAMARYRESPLAEGRAATASGE